MNSDARLRKVTNDLLKIHEAVNYPGYCTEFFGKTEEEVLEVISEWVEDCLKDSGFSGNGTPELNKCDAKDCL